MPAAQTIQEILGRILDTATGGQSIRSEIDMANKIKLAQEEFEQRQALAEQQAALEGGLREQSDIREFGQRDKEQKQDAINQAVRDELLKKLDRKTRKGVERTKGRQRRKTEGEKFERGAPERLLKKRKTESEITENVAQAEASRAMAEKRRKGEVKPDKISTWDGFQSEVDQEVALLMKNFNVSILPMAEVRQMAVEAVIARNGGNVAAIKPGMSERDVFNALKRSLTGSAAGGTADDILTEVTGEKK